MTNKTFRQLRALVTAGRAAMTDDDRKMIREDVDAKDPRAVEVARSVLNVRITEEFHNIGQQLGTGRNRELIARVELLNDALAALDRRNVELVLDVLLTTRTGLCLLLMTDEQCKAEVPIFLGSDLPSAKAMLAPLGVEFFKRADAFFETKKIGFKVVTEEVPVVRMLTFGTWELDEQTKALEAAQLEVEYAERGYAEVQSRCEAEPGDRISQQLADERRVCRERVYDAHLKRRLVQLGRADLAWQYACGEVAIHPWEERGPVELADAIAAEFAAPAAA